MSTSSAKLNNHIRVYVFLAIVGLLGAGIYFAGPYFSAALADNGAAEEHSEGESGPDSDVEADEETDEQVTPVELAAVEQGDISYFLPATANLRAHREVDVTTRVEGIIRALPVEEGQPVKAGQLLVQLDDDDSQIQLQSAGKRLAQARLQLEKARTQRHKAQTQIDNTQEDLARYQSLYEAKLVSEREVAQLRYQLDELQHDEQVSGFESNELEHKVSELESEIAQARLEISRAAIRAPFAGLITAREVELGQNVQSSDTLVSLANLSSLYADVFVSEQAARQVNPGQRVRVSLGQGGDFSTEASVGRISPVVDEETGTVKVTVEITKVPPEFRPGAFVRTEIQTDTHADALLIPKRALLEQDGRVFVFIAEGGKVRRAELTVGYENQSHAEIVEGVELGQKVVVAGQGTLKDGSPVKVVTG